MKMTNLEVRQRLLIVIPVYGSYRAFLKGLASWLSERGWEVHVATNLMGAMASPDVATFHQIDMPRGANPLQLFKASRQLTALIRELQPTVVHAHFSVGMLVLALARQVTDVRRLGTFQGLRFPLDSGISRWVFKCVECFSILRLDQSWVLTADDYCAVPKFARRRLAIQEGYGFGCDVEHFDPARFSESDKLKFRSELGIPGDSFVFIYVGRLTAFKGYSLALEAFQQLRNEHEDIHFLVVGDFDSQHPIDLPDLNSLEGVHHAGWQDDPAPYLAVADTMVFPSEREGVPVCVMEALSMGLFVVGNDVRGINKLLEDFGGRRIPVSPRGESCVRAVQSAMADALNAKQSESAFSPVREKLNRQFFYETVLRDYA
jgi:glycosyltransferase involved in cell wall biosynthesis